LSRLIRKLIKLKIFTLSFFNGIKAYSVRTFFFGLFIVFIYSCANIVPPNGGIKDTTPPKVIKSEPGNGTVKFNSRLIRIVFDEYIKLNNLNTQLMISPPQNNLPDIYVKGKSLFIKIKDTLAPNTTYNFYFGNAIADITESNVLANYQYVLSTGDYLDSMSVRGTVLDAFDLKPSDGVYVMLYDSIVDSIPYLKRPLYLTKTDKTGKFQFNNLRNTDYKIFALSDANSNLLYDLPYEKIAFIDSLIKPDYYDEKKQLKEKKDTLTTHDSLSTDSIKVLLRTPVSYQMFMFEQKDTTQKVLKKTFERKGLVSAVFKYPVKNFKIEYPKTKNHNDIFIEEFNKTSDTLKLWIKDPALDTLYAVLYQNEKILDTINLKIIPRVSKRAFKSKLLIIPNVANNSTFDYFSNLVLNFNNPVKSINTDSIIFKEDSLRITPQFKFLDSTYRLLELVNNLKEEASYQLLIPSKSFTDIFNNEHDTLKLKFKTKKKDDYGTLILNVKLPRENNQYIILLLDEKEKIVKREIISTSQKIKFINMKPGKYFVKTIYDENNDGKWNSGNYLGKKQSEKVYINKGDIITRANWDVEIEIKIE